MSIHRVDEVVLSILALFWGVILMLPGDLFAGIERYRLMAEFFPDTAWGAVFVVSGVITLIRMPRWMHRRAHWILCTEWAGMAILSLLSTISPPALLIASLLMAVSWIHASKYMRFTRPYVTQP